MCENDEVYILHVMHVESKSFSSFPLFIESVPVESGSSDDNKISCLHLKTCKNVNKNKSSARFVRLELLSMLTMFRGTFMTSMAE